MKKVTSFAVLIIGIIAMLAWVLGADADSGR